MLRAAEITLTDVQQQALEEYLSGPVAADAEFQLADLPLTRLGWCAKDTYDRLLGDHEDARLMRKYNDDGDNFWGEHGEHPNARLERFEQLVAAYKAGTAAAVLFSFSRLDNEVGELLDDELLVAAARRAGVPVLPALLYLD